MHICLFGGAFDPPHLGHQYIARALLKHRICDQVWFVPVQQHPFGKEVGTNGHREQMLKFIVESNMRVEHYELNQSGKSYSFDTLRALSVQHPQNQYSWIIGSDNLSQFHLWHRAQELVEKYVVYVYPRKGFSFKPLQKGMIALDTFPEIDISSTQVRAKISAGESITGLVDPRIERYIMEKGLYL